MATHFTCPSCQKTLRVSDKLLGKYISCPVCAKPFWADPHANTPVKNLPASAATALNQFWESAIVPSAESPTAADSPKEMPEPPRNEPARSSPANQSAPPPPPKTHSAKPATDHDYWNNVRLTAFVLTAAIIFILGGTAFLISLLPKQAAVEAAKEPVETAEKANESHLRPAAEQAEDKSKAADAAPLSAEAIFARASPAVVQVLIQNRQGRTIARGSGFLVSPKGLIATNYHVIEKAHKAHVVLADKAELPVVGVAALDEEADIAIIKVADRISATPLELAGADLPPVGARVFPGDHMTSVGPAMQQCLEFFRKHTEPRTK